MPRNSDVATSRLLSRLLAVIVTVVLITALYLAKTVVLPLALALLLSFVLAPLVKGLERIRLPRIVAIPIVLLTTGAVVGTVGWTVMVQLVEVTDALPAYRSNIHDKLQSFQKSKTTSFVRAQKELDNLGKQLDDLRSEFADSSERLGETGLGSSSTHPVSVREVGGSQGRLQAMSGLLGGVISIVLVAVFTFFMLLKREDLRNRLIQLSGHGRLNLMTQAMDDASHRVSRYLTLQWLVNITFGLIIFVVLHLMGLPHALLFGAVAGLLRFIPYIGAPIGALLPTALSIAVFNGWTRTLLILTIFFCMEIVTANLLEPHVYGKHTAILSCNSGGGNLLGLDLGTDRTDSICAPHRVPGGCGRTRPQFAISNGSSWRSTGHAAGSALLPTIACQRPARSQPGAGNTLEGILPGKSFRYGVDPGTQSGGTGPSSK